MNIELKNIKYFATMSEETHCFEATLYVEGKNAGAVSNRGQGGCNEYYLKPEFKYENINKAVSSKVQYEDRELTRDLDWICSDIVDDWLTRREIVKDLKAKWVMRSTDNKIYEIKKTRVPEVARIKAKWPDHVVLNDLTIDEAIRHIKECLSDK